MSSNLWFSIWATWAVAYGGIVWVGRGSVLHLHSMFSKGLTVPCALTAAEGLYLFQDKRVLNSQPNTEVWCAILSQKVYKLIMNVNEWPARKSWKQRGTVSRIEPGQYLDDRPWGNNSLVFYEKRFNLFVRYRTKCIQIVKHMCMLWFH